MQRAKSESMRLSAANAPDVTHELFAVRRPDDALAELLAGTAMVSENEAVSTRSALGRLLARDIAAHESLPPFDRSTMDGFAVCARDTSGAADSSPAYLRVTGEIPMGCAARADLQAGCAVRVHTGSMLPPGADAVVIVEDTNALANEELEVLRAVAPGDNIMLAGEDVRAGDAPFALGRPLRPHDLGALHALGIVEVRVVRRPVIAVLSTGDELVAPATRLPRPGEMRDANAATLCALIESGGGVACAAGIAPDDLDALEGAMRAALADADALVLSAGSSVSVRDLTASAIDRLGPPGVFVHGIAIRPGKPTVLGFCGSKPVVGLPGNPVSAAVVARRIVVPLVRRLAGLGPDDLGALEGTHDATLAASVASRPGREEYVPCTLARTAGDGGLIATPRFGSSGSIFTLVRAGGLIVVPFDRAGLAAGERARVALL